MRSSRRRTLLRSRSVMRRSSSGRSQILRLAQSPLRRQQRALRRILMLQISELSGRHDRESFDCGKPELNKYLQQVAAQHVKKSLAKVYVACSEDDLTHVLAFYSLNGCEIASSELPESFRKRF